MHLLGGNCTAHKLHAISWAMQCHKCGVHRVEGQKSLASTALAGEHESGGSLKATWQRSADHRRTCPTFLWVIITQKSTGSLSCLRCWWCPFSCTQEVFPLPRSLLSDVLELVKSKPQTTAACCSVQAASILGHFTYQSLVCLCPESSSENSHWLWPQSSVASLIYNMTS